VRFTANDDILYAIFPPPEEGDALTLAALGTAENAGVALDVTMLGRDGPLPWSQDEDALTVALPADLPCEHACALRISLGQA